MLQTKASRGSASDASSFGSRLVDDDPANESSVVRSLCLSSLLRPASTAAGHRRSGPMREIVHFHLGPRAGHLATHQWNVAESLFAYSDADVDHGVEHDVDWRQGVGRNVCATLARLQNLLPGLLTSSGCLPSVRFRRATRRTCRA